MYSSAPATDTAIVTGDYSTLGSTAFSTAITYAGFSTTGYNDFALNNDGIANISKTGISKFGARNANYDVANVDPATGSASLTSGMDTFAVEAAGTTTDPKLVVTYSVTPQGIVISPASTPTPQNRASGEGQQLGLSNRGEVIV